MSQRAALLQRFRGVLEAPRCDLLRLGVEDCALQFGPLVFSQDPFSKTSYVLLLAAVTNGAGTVRALGRLVDGDGPPHLTVGCFAGGGGWARQAHSRSVRWQIAGAPTDVGLPTVEWSQEVAEDFDVQAFVDDLSEDAGLLGAAARGPVPALVYPRDR